MSIKHTLIVFVFIFTFFMDAFGQADDQLVQVGTEMYNFGDVKDALEVFKQALEINPKNVMANFMAGKCYIESINKDKSLEYFLKAYQLDPGVSDNILYLIGHANQLSFRFDEAINYYSKYIKSVPNTNLGDDKKFEEIKKSERKIAECNTAKILVKSPVNIIVENLGEGVNSVDEDYAPVITPDESTLYFTSRRKGSTGEKKDNDNEFFEDVYVTTRTNGKWGEPKNLGKPVNSELHDACIGISPNGKTLFIYKDNDKYKGDIFYCKLNKDGLWSNPTPLGSGINTDYIEKAVTLSSDGKTLYFSSDRPGGKGGMDLYVTKMNAEGDWEDPVNLGEPINTEFDDDGPSLAADNVTLYFSSKGHEGMGGFDVFKSTYDTVAKKWNQPSNLRYPINSPDDDIYFVLSGNGEYGYYASVKQDGIGDVDIYRIRMPDVNLENADSASLSHKKTIPPADKKLVEVKKESGILPVVINISVVNKNGEKINSGIEILQSNGNKRLVKAVATGGTYKYSFVNKSEGEYVITAEKEGYIFKSKKIKIPRSGLLPVAINEILELEEVKVGVRRILKNIYFDYNKATITQSSRPELDKLYNLLKENSHVKVEIDGHTDSYGSNMYNINLSQRRAESVINWLVGKGIVASRLKAKGYGEEMPLATNDDENEGRELNRRTEFVITEN